VFLNIPCSARDISELLKKYQYRQHFSMQFMIEIACNKHGWMFSVSILRMNDQQQSFRPLVNNTVDEFLVYHVQQLFSSGLVSDGRCFRTFYDTPAVEEHPKLNNPRM